MRTNALRQSRERERLCNYMYNIIREREIPYHHIHNMISYSITHKHILILTLIYVMHSRRLRDVDGGPPARDLLHATFAMPIPGSQVTKAQEEAQRCPDS